MRKLKRELTAKNDAAKKAKEAFDEHERHCLTRMEQDGIESQRSYGTTFSPVQKVYAQVQDRSAFVAWAKENDEELIQDKERKTELDRVVRTALEDGQELPPGIGFYTREYISQRNAA